MTDPQPFIVDAGPPRHGMHYRAGLVGFGRDSAPHWYCDCGGWKFMAKPMPRARAGNNLAAAQRDHDRHVAAAEGEAS